MKRKPELQKHVREIHPEVCFADVNGGQPIPYGKKSKKGKQTRHDLLIKPCGFPCEFIELPIRDINKPHSNFFHRDDFYDACIACWMAECISEDMAIPIPEKPPIDSKHLPMAIWSLKRESIQK